MENRKLPEPELSAQDLVDLNMAIYHLKIAAKHSELASAALGEVTQRHQIDSMIELAQLSGSNYSNVRLTYGDGNAGQSDSWKWRVSGEMSFNSHVGALQKLRSDGYTETHWDWEDRKPDGVQVTFRNPKTGRLACLDLY